MTITTNHPRSSYGIPVILDDDGQLLDYGPGVRAIREKLLLTRQELADKTGFSIRTIEAVEVSRLSPSARLLNAMGDLIK
jgi:DNA-binding XRE family transcriptional regulator